MTRFYGVDCWPEESTPAYRRYWMSRSVPILRARDLIGSGEVSLDDIYDVAMVAFNDEDVAAELMAVKMEAMNKSASLRGE